jgi:hypothetical protein
MTSDMTVVGDQWKISIGGLCPLCRKTVVKTNENTWNPSQKRIGSDAIYCNYSWVPSLAKNHPPISERSAFPQRDNKFQGTFKLVDHIHSINNDNNDDDKIFRFITSGVVVCMYPVNAIIICDHKRIINMSGLIYI